MNTQVAGISFARDRSEKIASMRPVGAVSFEAEPDNKYDAGAVRVMYKGEHIGYVPRGDAQKRAIEAGTAVVADYLYMGDKEKYPPKGWNHDHNGVLGSVTLSLGTEEEDAGKVIGGKYLRVTSFLGFFNYTGNSDGLIRWAFDQSDTFDGYKGALNATATAGTDMHSAIEQYLTDGTRSPQLPTGWDAFVKKYEPEPISMELRFYDNRLMVTGQYDFFGWITYKGARVLAIMDWKSSKKTSLKHKLQGSIYAENVEHDGERPIAVVVAFGAENKQGFSVSVVDRESVVSNYMAMRHLRALIDAVGVWVPEDRYM